MMISWWSKHVGVILSVLMCDIWINVLLQTSALVGPLHILRVKCFLRVRNYRIFRQGENLRLCITGKFNNTEINAEVRLFKGVEQTLITVIRICGLNTQPWTTMKIVTSQCLKWYGDLRMFHNTKNPKSVKVRLCLRFLYCQLRS
jgi:hypothetical protein